MQTKSEYHHVQILADGTLSQPNLHDSLLKEYSLKDKKLTLTFFDNEKEKYLLIFPQIEIINLNLQQIPLMLFRVSCFDLSKTSIEYFYLNQAVEFLGFQSLNQILAEFGQTKKLNYLEGISGTIAFLSDKPFYKAY